MVVDDVEHDGEARGVRGVDQALEALRAAVARLRGRQVDAVVAPAARARELGDRHDLDRGDPQLGEAGQVLDRGVERPLARERADVQLVEDEIALRHARASRRRVQAKAETSTTRDGPRKPLGCQREQGSGQRLPSRTNQ